MLNKIPLYPQNIASMISYTDWSIVSKKILKSDSLELTLFAVSKWQDFEEHTTVKNAIVHIIEWNWQFYITDKWHKFQSWDYFYMEPNCVHALKADNNYKFLLYLF